MYKIKWNEKGEELSETVSEKKDVLKSIKQIKTQGGKNIKVKKLVELKEPKGRVKCASCGTFLSGDEINSNVGLYAENKDEFYCDDCAGQDEDIEEDE